MHRSTYSIPFPKKRGAEDARRCKRAIRITSGNWWRNTRRDFARDSCRIVPAAESGHQPWIAFRFGPASLVLVFSVARRAERFARLQMEFVAGVSHELCTPLALISSAVENLADGVVEDRKQNEEYAGILKDQGGRLERLLDQVLLFASGKVERTESELRSVDVGAIVEQSVAISEPMLREAGFKAETMVSDHLPAVKANPEAVSKCLENLISNAIKYGGPTQWVGVQAQAVNGTQKAEVQVSVRDQGRGISPEDLPHIFEPFYRTQEVRDGQIRGVGLGLHLVKRMMEGMGGRVTVTSETNRGTCFVLHFPAVAPEDHT